MPAAAATALLLAPLIAAPAGFTVSAVSEDSTRKMIQRADDEAGWPFAIDQGELSCLAHAGKRFVFFSEPWPEYDLDTMTFPYIPRKIAVSTDPVVLVMANLEDRALLKPFSSLEELIRRIAPYETAGRQLCEPPVAETP